MKKKSAGLFWAEICLWREDAARRPVATVASDFNARPADIRGLRVRARRLGRLTWRDAMRGAATALWRLVQVAPWPGYMRDDST